MRLVLWKGGRDNNSRRTVYGIIGFVNGGFSWRGLGEDILLLFWGLYEIISLSHLIVSPNVTLIDYNYYRKRHEKAVMKALYECLYILTGNLPSDNVVLPAPA